MVEGFTKVLLILTVFLGALSLDVKGRRVLKGEVDQPQNFGNFGSGFPNPGSIPNPLLGGGSFPNPFLGGGSFPNPNLGVPNQDLGFGPSTFCAYGVPCAKVRLDPKGGAGVSGSP